MTVGIGFTNGREAVSLTDVQVLMYGRKSDSVNKTGIFNRDQYRGVVFGAGSGDRVMHIIESLGSIQGNSLEEMVKALQVYDISGLRKLEKNWMEQTRLSEEQKLAMIDDPKIKGEVYKQMLKEADERLKEGRNRYKADIIVMGYDKNSNKIKLYGINDEDLTELTREHVEIGSGADGAHLYFSGKLQGVEPAKLTVPELVFFGINAYGFASINHGVGGAPRITLVNGKGVRTLSHDRSVALANLSGAYLAEFNPERLNRGQFMSHIEELISDGEFDLKAIARGLDLNPKSVTTKFIPYSSWQQTANECYRNRPDGENH